MPTPRSVITLKGNNFGALTLMNDDRVIEGSWSHPNVPLLIFADNILANASVTFHGGAIGTGLPVQLLFRGSWWLTPEGSDRRAMIEVRTQEMLASDYFSALSQYGINKPRWRGATIVTRPSPPMTFTAKSDYKVVADLIDDLIDDDVFPDPDDERIAYVVLMPKGFVEATGANGSHLFDYNYEFPFDKDYYWVAWLRAFEDAPSDIQENVIRSMSHELVELFTDPEADAWYSNGANSIEIGDAAVSPDPANPTDTSGNTGTKQTAWVNGARVQAYWSNQHAATVIPIDRDYQARIRGAVNEEGGEVLDHGTFRPDPQDQNFCEFIPACCLPDRDFNYKIVGHDEVIRLHIETQRYRQPNCAWAIEGVPISGSGMLTVNIFTQRFAGRRTMFGPTDVTIAYVATGTTIEMRAVGEKMNFDLTVGCKVNDASIEGNVLVNVIATPSVHIGFAGAELILDAEYVNGRKACNKAVADMFANLGHGGISRRPKFGEPAILDHGLLSELPAYTRVTQFQAAYEVLQLARMAVAVLPAEVAQAYAISLVADVPALADALAARSQTA